VVEYAGRGRYGDRDANPRTEPSRSSTATIAAWAAAVLVDPGLLLLGAALHHVERDRRIEDLTVVDRAYRVGVTSLDEPQRYSHRTGT